ncbi:MAG: hypothetical protein KDC54_10730, partial [Lewinella sp.]|nr:hypothetical protein [Lewinella sp.]
KLFWRNLRKAQKAYPDEDGWQGAHFRIQSALSFLEHDQLLSEEQQLRIEPLKAGVERLDITYLQQRLAQSCDLLTYSRLLKTPLDLGLLPDLLTYIEAHWQSIGTIPIIELYYHCARMNLHPEDNTHYEQMKEKLDQYEEGIGYRDRKNIYRQIFNHCIEKVNAGDVQFHRETLAIYKRLLRDDFVLQNGEIKQSTYNNIASLACTEGEVDWGEQFVRDYARYLAPEVRENAFASNLATIYFYQGKFSEALGLIHQVVFTNFYYQQKSRFLQVRIYYELGEEEPMLSALESFRILAVRNKKMLGAQRVAIQNFVRFTKALMKLFSERKTLRPARLHERAEDLCERILSITEPFFGKDWLLEKLRELTVY